MLKLESLFLVSFEIWKHSKVKKQSYLLNFIHLIFLSKIDSLSCIRAGFPVDCFSYSRQWPEASVDLWLLTHTAKAAWNTAIPGRGRSCGDRGQGLGWLAVWAGVWLF